MSAAPRVTILDELRGFAALYVAAAHVVLHNLKLESFWAKLPWLFGQEMVMVFFVISGAAIRLSVIGRHGEVSRTFLQRRFLRLFPMVVLGLVAGYLAAALEAGAWLPARWGELLGNLLFVQDFAPVKPGTICSTYYGNAMLWSLSYEWWFYVIFFLVWNNVSVARRTHVAGVISLVGSACLALQPNAPAYWAAYFIAWWAGGTLVESDARERRRALGWMVANAVCVALVMFKVMAFEHVSLRPGVYPLLLVRHLGVIAGLFGVVVMAGPWLRRLAGRVRGFAWAAPMSYALYVVHYPLASDARWLARTGLPDGIASAVVYGGIALASAWLAEKFYQPWAGRQLSRVPGLRSGREKNQRPILSAMSSSG